MIIEFINNYLCNQCLSPLTLWVRILLRRGVLDTTLCDKFVSDLRQVGCFLWVIRFPPPKKKTDCHDISEILLKVALNTITLTMWLEKKWHVCDKFFELLSVPPQRYSQRFIWLLWSEILSFKTRQEGRLKSFHWGWEDSLIRQPQCARLSMMKQWGGSMGDDE